MCYGRRALESEGNYRIQKEEGEVCYRSGDSGTHREYRGKRKTRKKAKIRVKTTK